MNRIAYGLLFSICLISNASAAGRTVHIPSYTISSYHDFTKSPFGAAYTPNHYSNRVRAGIQLLITLNNISSSPQTGTLTVNGGSMIGSSCCYADGTGREWNSGAHPGWTITTGICGGTNTPTATNQWPGPVNFTLGKVGDANSTVVLALSVGFSDLYDPADSLTSSISMAIRPQMTLVINEDRGAILGTLAVNLPLSSLWSNCTGFSPTTQYDYGTYLNSRGDNQIIFLNGGRPF